MFEAHVPASILFGAWRNCAETERAGTMFTAFQFRRSLQEKKHPKIREASIFLWPFIGKKGMLLHEIAKNLLKPRKITS